MMDLNRQQGFRKTQRFAIDAAKDLLYGDDVIRKLKAATTEGQIEVIMRTARKERIRD